MAFLCYIIFVGYAIFVLDYNVFFSHFRPMQKIEIQNYFTFLNNHIFSTLITISHICVGQFGIFKLINNIFCYNKIYYSPPNTRKTLTIEFVTI